MAKTIHILIGLCLFIGGLYLPSVEAAPDITAYNNSISDDTLFPHQQVNTNIQFNVTANETIVIWAWIKDGTTISNNYDNYTTSWTGAGQKNITVTATNANGTTEPLTWYPWIEQEMAGAGDVVDELNISAYDDIIEVFSSEDPNYETFLSILTQPHTNILGSLFYVVLFGTPFLLIWVSQGSAKIPAVLGAMLAPILLSFFSPSYVPITVVLILLVLFSIIYGFYKERR